MKLIQWLAVGVGAFLLLKKKGPSGQPHDEVITSPDQIRVGMSWSSVDGHQWTLDRKDGEYVELVRSTPTASYRAHMTVHELIGALSDEGILLIGPTGTPQSNLGAFPYRSDGAYPITASSPSIYGPGSSPPWDAPDPWSSGGAWGLTNLPQRAGGPA